MCAALSLSPSRANGDRSGRGNSVSYGLGIQHDGNSVGNLALPVKNSFG